MLYPAEYKELEDCVGVGSCVLWGDGYGNQHGVDGGEDGGIEGGDEG